MNTQISSDYGAFVLRIASGVLFIAHGLMKVLIFTVPGTIAFFESLGVPGYFAYLTLFAELVGGTALILGVSTRLVSVAVMPVLIGATWTHSSNGWSFTNTVGGWEFPLFWTFVQASLILIGGGAFRLRLPILQKALGPQFA
ncbi:DoxX family protein [Breoghania sp.]|uniref:DoxX family protein n=1 Tax=Breoghania sp. TaxID=2065378 RepID=UPI00261B0AC1|nr:DoxX family protein [Breoghania sp.]MDJ0933350.1 DoxX family protein [Breoghania sp.]